MRNVCFCAKCWQVLESKHRHDYVVCGCENQTMTDGGHDYIRRGGKDPNLVVHMSPDDISNYEAFAGDYDKATILKGLKAKHDMKLIITQQINEDVRVFTFLLDKFTEIAEKDHLKRLAGVDTDNQAASLRRQIIQEYRKLLEAK